MKWRAAGMAALLFLANCGVPKTNDGNVVVSVVALQSTEVSSITVTISGPELPKPISLPIKKQNGQWGGQIENIPAGKNRTVVAMAFDTAKRPVFAGAAAGVVVAKGATAHVVIYLQEMNVFSAFINHAPVIYSLSASSLLVQPSDTVSLGVAAHDPDPNDTLVAAWKSSCGSFDHSSSWMPSWKAPSTEQTCIMNVTVTDNHGAQTTASLEIAVKIAAKGSGNIVAISDSNPVVTDVLADPYALDSGTSTTLTVVAIDPDLDPLTFKWDTLESACTGNFSDAQAQTTVFTLAPGSTTKKCTLVVTVTGGLLKEGRGASSLGLLTLPVGPPPEATVVGAPQITVTSQSTDQAQGGEVVVLAVNARHTAQPPRPLKYDWIIPPGSVGKQTDADDGLSSQYLWTLPDQVEGDITAEVVVSDDRQVTVSHAFTLH